MNSRQTARLELEKIILEMLLDGMDDESIMKETGCSIGRIRTVRLQRGWSRKSQIDESTMMHIEDLLIKQMPIKNEKVVCNGKKYIDITGSIVDCGLVYRGK